ncbi:MAG TPA: tRNA lysidine(34) synthetase TilS [Candidatus Absconditabacterales bacterium]|nr:tRNA lysidine(34) synthetase TilS [Candidatus Absconditabacterales bacterium]HMT26709.1 tRNA lysidine(34) synthetase TilS [Candidatus Absconditabacterales bacterium]
MKTNREKYTSGNKNLNSAKILTKSKTVIVGVSGGPDSMVTAHRVINFYQKSSPKAKIIIAHFNHNQRKEAASEEQWIKKQFIKQEIEIGHHQKNKSTEEELRNARHQFFEKIAKKHKSKILFLGHNLTDRIETSLLNMARGCEQDGFINMKTIDEKENLVIIRPLLHLTKKEIIAIAKKEKIKFLIDKSNFSIKTSKRNYIRNKIFPLLEKISNKSKSGRENIYESFSKIYDLYEKKKIKRNLPKKRTEYKIFTPGIDCQCRQRSGQNLTPKDIAETIKRFHPEKNRSQAFIKQTDKFLNSINTKGFTKIGDIFFFKGQKNFFICKTKEIFWEKEIETKKKITRLGEIEFGNQKISITESFLGATLRFPKKGDKRGSKTLAKIFINNKIPVFERYGIPIIEKDKEIVKIFYPKH